MRNQVADAAAAVGVGCDAMREMLRCETRTACVQLLLCAELLIKLQQMRRNNMMVCVSERVREREQNVQHLLGMDEIVHTVDRVVQCPQLPGICAARLIRSE